MSKHTPEPWEIRSDESCYYFICNSNYSYWTIADHILEKDVNLIAAAPDLLEALHHAIEEIEVNHFELFFDTDLLYKAIAKAKGENSNHV